MTRESLRGLSAVGFTCRISKTGVGGEVAKPYVIDGELDKDKPLFGVDIYLKPKGCVTVE